MTDNDLQLLIDMDYFLYRAASASEIEMDYSQDLTVVVGDFAKGTSIVESELDKLRSRFSTNNILIALTDETNFRKTVDPTYKGNRTKRKPAGYLKLKRWAMAKYPSVMKPTLEADDVMGILATNGSLKNFVLISPDKDMAQIPCRIYDLKTEYTQTPEDAERKLYEQCLTGDSCDGYSGCIGVGPKRAAQILNKCKGKNYWQAVLKAYDDSGQTEEDAIRNFNLARILQADTWDSKNQSPILLCN